MADIGTLLLLIPGLPLAAALLTPILGPRILRRQSHLPAVIAILLACVCSLVLVQEVSHRAGDSPSGGYERVFSFWNWALVPDANQLPNGTEVDFAVDITLRADALTATMLAMVTFISTLVVIYSVGYMHGDRGYWRFFTYVSLFVFSMTMLVSVSNYVLLYVFWEAVGVCSYLLIGFWYQKPAAAAAGTKAFLVNRVGDFGFALALFLIWTSYGTLDFHSAGDVEARWGQQTAQAAETMSGGVAGVLSKERIQNNAFVGLPGSGKEHVALAICLLLMLGACGKSAQWPLHVWLPDAMEGPTPVSALIHAATMVTAGVYMVARCTPLFMVSPTAQIVVACIGAGTALLAALIALTQFDLKRVLAYSTISQLGFMFLALGTGTLAGITSGMFHLFTHAFFKALLFLGAGSVMHAMGNVIDMRQFGGLRRVLPITYWTFLIGSLALAGLVPLSGFWSKDAVLGSVHDKAHALAGHTNGHAVTTVSDAAPHVSPDVHSEAPHHWHAGVYDALYWIAVLTSLLTAFYTVRALCMTFFGERRIPEEAHGHAHESPWTMCGPLVVLAFCAAFVGIMFDQSAFTADESPIDVKHAFAGFLGQAPQLAAGAVADTDAPGKFHPVVAVTSTLVALLGMGLACYLYMGDRKEIRWLSDLLQFQWLAPVAGADWVGRLRRIGWVTATDQFLRRVGLGWLASLVGYALLAVLMILAAPILLGYFVSPYRLSSKKFYFDEIYSVTIVWPLRLLASICYGWDRFVIDGLVNFIGRVPAMLGQLLRSLQMGLVSFYALAMVLGLLILLVTRMFWGSA